MEGADTSNTVGGSRSSGGFDPEVVATRLQTEINATDVKFRPVGGGKQAAYIPADAVM
jgi:hypothetical protein